VVDWSYCLFDFLCFNMCYNFCVFSIEIKCLINIIKYKNVSKSKLRKLYEVQHKYDNIKAIVNKILKYLLITITILINN